MPENVEKYQIFISSPFKKMEKQRKAAVEAIVNWRHIPIALERFSAKAETDREIIRKTINDCQIYIIMIGHRYGSLVPGADISYTEMEFDIAKEAKLSILAFIRDEKEAANKLRDDKTILDRDKPKELLNLDRFREKIRESAFSTTWKSSTNFEELVGRALAHLIYVDKAIGRPGWVRAESEIDSLGVRTALKNPFVLDTVKNLNLFRRLDRRCGTDIPNKKAVGQCIREKFLETILGRHFDIFFESGSTPAYVARELGKSSLFRKAVSFKEKKSSTALYTNNILVFLQLWLNNGLPISMLPRSSPTEPYGGSYGILEEFIEPDRNPDFSGDPLMERAQLAISRFAESPDALRKDRRIVILGAMSGLQLSDDCVFSEDSILPAFSETKDLFHSTKGFHVGSFINKIFKRYLYSTKFPKIMLATDAKIDMEISPDRCHFIFDRGFSWDSFIAEYPLAFCVGCRFGKHKEICDKLELIGFQTDIYAPATGWPVVIAENTKFKKEFYGPGSL